MTTAPPPDGVTGPSFHGTRAELAAGRELVPGHRSHFRPGQPLAHVCSTALVDTAAWGAELAAALADQQDDYARGRICVVEPLGPFEDDPNVTGRKFPGDPTQSYRTRHPLRVVSELEQWEGHSPEVLAGMLANLRRLRERGLDIVED